MDLDTGLQVGLQIAKGLQVAHEAGICHLAAEKDLRGFGNLGDLSLCQNHRLWLISSRAFITATSNDGATQTNGIKPIRASGVWHFD